jgi:hypothetical protein
MRAGLITALQVGLAIAAMSSLPEPASAASCTCTCYGARSLDSPRNYSISMGKCSDLNGRYCSLPASDPAGQRAGITASGQLTNCTGG